MGLGEGLGGDPSLEEMVVVWCGVGGNGYTYVKVAVKLIHVVKYEHRSDDNTSKRNEKTYIHVMVKLVHEKCISK